MFTTLANLRCQSLKAEVLDLVTDLPVGTYLSLKRDTTNAYDDNAIRVFFTPEDGAEHFVGFVERGPNAEVADMMDKGILMQAHLRTPTGDRKTPWLMEIREF